MAKVLLMVLLMAAMNAKSQKMMLMTDETTDVTFATRHVLGRLEGSFKGVNGSAIIDTNNIAGSFLKLSFATVNVLQNDYQMGPNLIKPACLDPLEFPEITLSSTAITKLTTHNLFQFTGNLTVKGITKPLSFPFTAAPNFGGYDFAFTFPIVKKLYDLHCSVKKNFQISVRSYGKIIVPL